MWIESSKYNRREFAPIIENRDTAWEIYERIDPVALAYRLGPEGSGRLHVSEQNSARRLLKELHRLGREGIPVKGMLSTAGALDTPSVRALNCYLAHSYSKKSWRQLAGTLHRHSWYELQRTIAARWIT